MVNRYLPLIIKSTVAAQNSVNMVNSTHKTHARQSTNSLMAIQIGLGRIRSWAGPAGRRILDQMTLIIRSNPAASSKPAASSTPIAVSALWEFSASALAASPSNTAVLGLHHMRACVQTMLADSNPLLHSRSEAASFSQTQGGASPFLSLSAA